MKRRTGYARALAVALVLAQLAGCAMLEHRNRRTLNLLDEKVRIGSAAGRAVLAPVAVPAATLVLAADAVVVHPATQVPKAAKDIYDLYWKPRDADWFIKSVVFLPIVALTPPTFAGDLVLRCLFPIDSF